jgi:ribonuclease P protein component
MIAREHRFHGYNSLSFVYRKGRIVRDRYCSLKYTANPRRQTSRVAVVASRKLSKSAVVRNRIRRRIYEQVRGGGVVSGGVAYDLVFTAYDEKLADISVKELNKIISKLLQAIDSSRTS